VKSAPSKSLLAWASETWHEWTRPPYKRSAPVEDTIAILDFDGPAQYGPHKCAEIAGREGIRLEARAMSGALIRTVAAVIADGDGRVLLVRKRGSRTFIQPGGKREAGEDALTTLARELHEELGVTMRADSARRLGEFEATPSTNPAAACAAKRSSSTSTARQSRRRKSKNCAGSRRKHLGTSRSRRLFPPSSPCTRHSC
jgi:hypothetical protein